MNTSLEDLYNQINEIICSLDFEAIWKGFRPYKFALYNDAECFFDGKYIEKTSDFCANTSIKFQGEIIAIWKVDVELEIPIFVSKIVHEMFHAFQDENGWSYCCANEMEALYKYRYNEENLSVKLHENKLLLDLLDGYDGDKYRELLSCRRYRQEKFPYEFSYECSGEEIEGSANYIEWKVLKILDKVAADKLIEDMRKDMIQPEYFFPIRISGYYTGALLINAMIEAKDYYYSAANRPVIINKISSIDPIDKSASRTDDEYQKVSLAIKAFNDESKRIVESAVKNDEVVLDGPYELVSVNIYDARCYEGYITSRVFLMYTEKGEQKVINGNFVIKMKDDKNIDKVFKWI